MEIAPHSHVKSILECAAALTPDNARRRCALIQACAVGRHIFLDSIGPHASAETDPAKALFRLVPSAPGPATPARPPASPSVSARSESARGGRSPDGEIAVPEDVTRILECVAELTPDNQERLRVLGAAAHYGEYLFFADPVPTETRARRASRLEGATTRGRTPPASARPARRRPARR